MAALTNLEFLENLEEILPKLFLTYSSKFKSYLNSKIIFPNWPVEHPTYLAIFPYMTPFGRGQ